MFYSIAFDQTLFLLHACTQESFVLFFSHTSILTLISVVLILHRYWCLLSWPLPQTTTHTSTADPDKAPDTILKYVFECLLSPKASVKVCSFVMEMSVTLLTSSERFGAGEMDETCEGGISDGEKLVRPFVPSLLEYLGRVISGSRHRGRLRKVDGRGKNLDYEFIVLSRCESEWLNIPLAMEMFVWPFVLVLCVSMQCEFLRDESQAVVNVD